MKSIILLFAAFGYARAAVTLFEVVPTATVSDAANGPSITQAGTTEVRAIGTGSDGKMTYVQNNIVSYYALAYPLPDDPQVTTTTTIISEAQTVAVTFAEDKNGYHATRSLSLSSPSGSPLSYQGGLDEKCTFNEDGTGSCVRVVVGLDEEAKTTYSTSTYSGKLNAWYTVSEAESKASETAAPSSGAVRNGGGVALAGVVAAMMASVMSALGVLGPLA
ncbi:hypothetical protein D9613_012312 [Agrocybe pediades]|uniref:Uncharacterized protein n=1 Tax=Agrocybe pediades TaxID=84607 RepID=A0A8H4QF80_9AGAR|nr:hypothetical protein D9613_012312 [Agrocybe pediades]